ncbi:volume-regulated anion channel subunit LRRC8D-like [Xiphophorus maculatus]|nr:volume-regulated anion channel subunit LRRC8D-like [Xiphophorus maculatus]
MNGPGPELEFSAAYSPSLWQHLKSRRVGQLSRSLFFTAEPERSGLNSLQSGRGGKAVELLKSFKKLWSKFSARHPSDWTMFSLSELAPVEPQQNTWKLLKPWWEIFMDYLVVLMLMTSVLACTVQLSRDRVVCIPSEPPFNASDGVHPPVGSDAVLASSEAPLHVPHSIGPNLQSPAQGRRTHLVYQQYIYVSQVCYHEALPFCSRFFPYMALLQSLLLATSGSFWLYFPHTSSRIEQFLSILAKCCESPWTSQALSQAARQENIRDLERPPRHAAASAAWFSIAPARTGHSSTDSGTDSPLLKKSAYPPSPCPSTVSSNSTMSSVSLGSETHLCSSEPPVNSERPGQVLSLDKSDGEQARALFERVRKFRSHCESSAVIYKVYLAQTIFKLLMVSLIMSYTVPFLSSLSFSHVCQPAEQTLVGYTTFECVHSLSSLLRKLLVTYLILLGIYALLNFYTLSWSFRSCLRKYSFHSLKDIPDLMNDLAFLIHMLEQYDPLLVQRLSVFLSPVSESRLLEQSLERHWGEEKLQALTSMDAEGCSTLQLVALPRLPPALFTLSQLQALKLELIADARFTSQVANMTSLRELHLYHCPAAADPGALAVLQERLEILHITFAQASQIPSWVLSLRNLHELHLSGRLGSEGGVGHGWALGSLRQLRHLRVLVIHGMLQRVPSELCEVAGSLVKLEIHNEGARLLVLTGLKRMADLTELWLQDCQLDRLPSALLALTRLQTLDLQHNNLRTLEELLGLVHLQRLSCLKLAYNRVLALPPTVGVLRGLELLDLSNNQLKSLPPGLFTLHRLRRLLLAGNLIPELPSEVKALGLLAELDLSGNRLESLTSDLFSCSELRILNVSRNSIGSLPGGISALSHLYRLDLRSNSLEELPAELGCCLGLCGGGLLVERWLFLSLPPHVRDFLSRSYPTSKGYFEDHSRPESDTFPYSPAQWSFSAALESQI